MTTYNAKAFGGYLYDDRRDGVGTLKNSAGYRHRQSKSFSRDGAFAVGSLQDPRRLSFDGVLTGANGAQDAASLRAAWDAFAAAHAAGDARPLSVDNDRYINAQVETLEDSFNGLSHQWTMAFLCFDPYWYALVSTLQALAVGGSDVGARRATCVRPLARLAEHLRRDDDLVAPGTNVLQRLPRDALGVASRVGVGGIEEVDPGLERAADHRVGVGLLHRTHERVLPGGSERHRAEAELGDEQTRGAQSIVAHVSMLRKRMNDDAPCASPTLAARHRARVDQSSGMIA